MKASGGCEYLSWCFKIEVRNACTRAHEHILIQHPDGAATQDVYAMQLPRKMATTLDIDGISGTRDGSTVMAQYSRGIEGEEGVVVVEVWSHQCGSVVLLMTARWSIFRRLSTYSQDGACVRHFGVVPCFGTAALLLDTRTEVRRCPLVFRACILISSNP